MIKELFTVATLSMLLTILFLVGCGDGSDDGNETKKINDDARQYDIPVKGKGLVDRRDVQLVPELKPIDVVFGNIPIELFGNENAAISAPFDRNKWDVWLSKHVAGKTYYSGGFYFDGRVKESDGSESFYLNFFEYGDRFGAFIETRFPSSMKSALSRLKKNGTCSRIRAFVSGCV